LSKGRDIALNMLIDHVFPETARVKDTLPGRLIAEAQIRNLPQNTYGFLAMTLPSSQAQIGVPCIRAASRAVRAARRIPRPTPAAKLSGFFWRFSSSGHDPRSSNLGLDSESS
jgi:hypothetical protein